MNEELWNVLSRYDMLTEDELDDKRKRIMDSSFSELQDQWKNMVRFSYNVLQYDQVERVYELGACTDIVIIEFSEDDIEKPNLQCEDLLSSMASQADYVGEIARIVTHDTSLELVAGGKVEGKDGIVQIEVSA